MNVIKRDGRKVDFDKSKIENAIVKAMKNVGTIERQIAIDIADEIYEEVKNNNEVTIAQIELLVYNKLISKDRGLIAKAYEGYRSIREYQRNNKNTIDNEVSSLLKGENDYWNNENSNKNPRLNTTQRDYIAGIISKDISRRYLLPPNIVHAHDEGMIHIHDMDYLIQPMNNCCLINLKDMLQNGTVISETLIEKPHSFSTACTVTTQIIAQVASSQYGGQSISLAHLAPFVDVSRKKFRKEVIKELNDNGFTADSYSSSDIESIVESRLKKEITKGIQTIQYQITTLMTTNG